MAGIEDLRRLVEQAKLETKEYQVWQVPSDTRGLPFLVGARTWDGVLLAEDVGVHLGGVGTPSDAILSATTQPAAVHDLRVTLVGQDISSIAGTTVSFILCVILAGLNITGKDIKELHRALHFTDEIEGFTQQSGSREMRFVLSKSLVTRGISFQQLGQAILSLYKAKFARILRAAEIIFLTGVPRLVPQFQALGQEALKHVAAAWADKIQSAAKLRVDCEFEWECGACEYQRICEQLRDIIRLRTQSNPIT